MTERNDLDIQADGNPEEDIRIELAQATTTEEDQNGEKPVLQVEQNKEKVSHIRNDRYRRYAQREEQYQERVYLAIIAGFVFVETIRQGS